MIPWMLLAVFLTQPYYAPDCPLGQHLLIQNGHVGCTDDDNPLESTEVNPARPELWSI